MASLNSCLGVSLNGGGYLHFERNPILVSGQVTGTLRIEKSDGSISNFCVDASGANLSVIFFNARQLSEHDQSQLLGRINASVKHLCNLEDIIEEIGCNSTALKTRLYFANFVGNKKVVEANKKLLLMHKELKYLEELLSLKYDFQYDETYFELAQLSKAQYLVSSSGGEHCRQPEAQQLVDYIIQNELPICFTSLRHALIRENHPHHNLAREAFLKVCKREEEIYPNSNEPNFPLLNDMNILVNREMPKSLVTHLMAVFDKSSTTSTIISDDESKQA